jgi:hypothetical protein
MATIIYGLCAFTAILCSYLLFRAHSMSRYPLLFWSGLCFACLAINNLLLIADRFILPNVNLLIPRLVFGLLAVLVLIYGMVNHDAP